MSDQSFSVTQSSSTSTFSKKSDSPPQVKIRTSTFSKTPRKPLSSASSPTKTKKDFLSSLYKIIENNSSLLYETENNFKFDVIDLTLLMRSMGFRLSYLDFADIPKGEEEEEVNGDNTYEIKVQFRCKKTGLLSKLSMKTNECCCPTTSDVNSFWEVQGVEPSTSADHTIKDTSIIQDTSCSLLPELTKNAMSFSKSIIMLALDVYRNELPLTKNFHLEKRKSLSPQMARYDMNTYTVDGSNENMNGTENSSENKSDGAAAMDISNDYRNEGAAENSFNPDENLGNFCLPRIGAPKDDSSRLAVIQNLQEARVLLDSVFDYLKRSRSPSFVPVEQDASPSDLLINGREEHPNCRSPQEAAEAPQEFPVHEGIEQQMANDEPIENDAGKGPIPGPIAVENADAQRIKTSKKLKHLISGKPKSKPVIVREVLLPRSNLNSKTNSMSPLGNNKICPEINGANAENANPQKPTTSKINKNPKGIILKRPITPVGSRIAKSDTPRPLQPVKKAVPAPKK